MRRWKAFSRRTTSGRGLGQAGNNSIETRPRISPKLTGSSSEARPCLVGELLGIATAHDAVVLGVECSYPEPCGPRNPELVRRERTPARTLIGVEKKLALIDRRRALHVRPCEDRRRSAGDGCFRAGRNAVPVMHDERPAVCPANVLRLPVDMTDDHWRGKAVEDRARSLANLIQPAWLGMYVEIPLAVIAERPYPSATVIPFNPR